MLTRLTINNLAIIENIEIKFGDGFTVLTGGTGAGKSLVIDSLSLLLGARASSELIRTGEEKASIKGYFKIHNSRLEAFLNKLDIDFIDDELEIERIMTRTKSVVKVNGSIISLTDLNKISKYLADIHNQFDFEKILNEDNYLDIIDGFSYDLTTSFINEYQSLLEDYKAKKHNYEELIERKRKIDESRDFYEYQLKELQGLNLTPGEEEEIEEKISLLQNYDKVYSLSQEANEIIHTDFLDKLYDLNHLLKDLSKYQSKYSEVTETIDNHYYELDDILQDLVKGFNNIDYDPNELNDLQLRASEINAAKHKYKKSVPELIEYINELESAVGEKSNIDIDIEDAKIAKDDAFNKCLSKGKDLSLVRQKLALTIEKELKRNLQDLLLNVNFKIEFKPIDVTSDSVLKENGVDTVDFLIETNVGEGLKPLAKIISGGEASRIMLAFKAIFIKANKVSTVIFDEIDTGISGEAAEAVANKIKEISLASQVIAITHMPQVASKSDHHILISKSVKNERTYTSIKELDLEGKIQEVAHLISGGKVTEKQLEYAKEMVLK